MPIPSWASFEEHRAANGVRCTRKHGRYATGSRRPLTVRRGLHSGVPHGGGERLYERTKVSWEGMGLGPLPHCIPLRPRHTWGTRRCPVYVLEYDRPVDSTRCPSRGGRGPERRESSALPPASSGLPAVPADTVAPIPEPPASTLRHPRVDASSVPRPCLAAVCATRLAPFTSSDVSGP